MDKHPIEGLMDTTLQKIKEMVDVNTVVGTPIHSEGGVTIIPISKVTYGFTSGGSNFVAKGSSKDLFGGGAGAGVTIKPEGFLVINGSDVKLLQLSESNNTIEKAINTVPGVIDQVVSLFKKEEPKE